MRNIAIGARVYRFGGKVALNIRLQDRTMETVYIEPDMAINLVTMVHDAAADIYAQPSFSESNLGTHRTVPCEDGVLTSRIEKE